MSTFKTLKCPECGAILINEEELDTFYCKYCGSKVVMEGQDANVIKAKTRIKAMKHKETLEENRQRAAQTITETKLKFKAEKEERDNKNRRITIFIGIAFFTFIIMLCLFMSSNTSNQNDKKIEQLNKTLAEIRIDVANKQYDEALLKAYGMTVEDLLFDDSKREWQKNKEDIIHFIEAEKSANPE